MILNSLTLENIRSYKQQKIYFPKGSVLLSGDVGSGKSTILIAIEFALFGLIKGQVSGVSLLRHGCNFANVVLNFNISGKEIEIKRTLKRGVSIVQSSGYLIVDGIKNDYTAVELKTRILELLGYPKDMLNTSNPLYRYTVYTPQEQMKRILSGDKESRLSTIRKILGIDKYQRVVVNAVLLTRHLKLKRNLLVDELKLVPEKKSRFEVTKKEKISLEFQESELKLLLDKFVTQINELEVNKKLVDAKIKEHEKLVVEKNMLVQKLEQKQQTKNNNTIKINTLTLELNALRKNNAELINKLNQQEFNEEDFATKKKLFDAKQIELQQLKEQNFKVNEQIKAINKNSEMVSSGIQENQEQLKELPLKKESMERLLGELDVRETLDYELKTISENKQTILVNQKLLNTKILTETKLINNISSLKVCETCMQNVDDDHKIKIKNEKEKLIKIYSENLVESKQKLVNITQKEEQLLIKKDDLEKIKEETINLGHEIKQLILLNKQTIEQHKELQRLKEEKARIKLLKNTAQILSLTDEVEKQQKSINAYQEVRLCYKDKQNNELLINAKNSDKENLLEEIRLIDDDVKTLTLQKFTLSESIALSKELYGEQKLIVEKITKTQSLQKEKLILNATITANILNAKQTLTILEKELKYYSEKELKIDQLGKLLHWLDKQFIPLTRNIEQHALLKAYEQFNDLFTRWFNLLIDDSTITARLDETFTPIMDQNGHETEIGILSGGEKTSVALAYRLALNKVLGSIMGTIKTNLLIFDEPTDGFSTQQLDKLKDLLDELQTPQIILVSHEQKIIIRAKFMNKIKLGSIS